MSIIFAPLEKALKSLKNVVQLRLDDVVRDSAIKRFEYTYELAWKMLKRYLQETSSSPSEIDELGFRDLIRLGVESGLLRDSLAWFGYRESRNRTNHTYNEMTANDVYNSIPAFIVDVDYLIAKLKSRINDNA